MLDGDTAVFRLPEEFGHGRHNVAIDAGTLLDLQGTPIRPFSARFVLDLVGPWIVASSLLQPDFVPVGSLVYTARFDEALDASKLDANDVRLVGTISGDHRPTAFRYDSEGVTLTVEFRDLPDDAYTLTLLAGEEGFGDLVGNALDGEAAPGTRVPSGDGTPNDGPCLPENSLNPTLGLCDQSGALVVSDDNGAADGRNARLTYRVMTGGRCLFG